MFHDKIDDEAESGDAPFKWCSFTFIGKKPSKLDYRKLKKMSKVKNQRKCGSCYIFAALGALESQYLLNSEVSTMELSEQAVLNCVRSGCHGGKIRNVWHFISKNGVPREEHFKYEARVGRCVSYPSYGMVYDYCYVKNKRGFKDYQLKNLLNKYGPVAALMNAKGRGFKHSKGKFKGKCDKRTNHAVLIAGYTKKYWIIKNSWSEKWGKKGYFYLPRGRNKCGINTSFGVPFLH